MKTIWMVSYEMVQLTGAIKYIGHNDFLKDEIFF